MVLGLAVALATAGCGGGKGTVSGKVYFNDKPLKGGNVTFHLEGKGSRTGGINEDGTYTVEDVSPGPATITVETVSLRPSMRERHTYQAPKGQKSPNEPEVDKSKNYVEIPLKYMEEKTSGLTYTVESGKQQHDIKLTGSVE
jgi:hypothetical protein